VIRPVRALLLLALVACVVPAAHAAGSAEATLTPVSRLPFPERGFLVGLPTDRHLTTGDVVVRENGVRVKNVSLVPAERSTARLASVLVIDASDSMRGKPLVDAFAAARAFADQFAHGQQVGIVTFNNTSHVAQKPTSDPSQIQAALASPPPTAQGTRIFDALSGALDLLRSAHSSAGTVILLSDGGDTGSTIRETRLATRAQRMHVRIFAVGLRSPTFRPAALRHLARDTRAAYAEATSSKELESIYTQIGRQLAGEYLLRYRSDADPGANVVVTLQLRGLGLTTYTYAVPKTTALPPFHRSIFQRFWTSAFSLVFLSLLAGVLIAAAVLTLITQRRSTLAERINEFASTLPDATDEEEKTPVSSRLFGRTERSLSRTRWWTRFREELEIANVKYSAEQILAAAVIGTLLVGLILYSIAPVFVVFAFLVPLLVRNLCEQALRRVRRQFEDQLPDNLQVLASALRAGHSFVGALSVVATDASEPSKREFTRVVADEQLGVPLEDSLREVARRMDSNDLEQVALVAELQRQSGGNMAEVLDRVVETVRGRFDLRRLVRTLTAQGRMARWILTFLPVALALLISLSNPRYLAPLFDSTGGQVAIAIAILMIVSGSLIIKKIINIRV